MKVIDFACRRVKHMIAAGSGYEMLIYYGNRILQDKILFASGWGTMLTGASYKIGSHCGQRDGQ
jgi:hypothetical protein